MKKIPNTFDPYFKGGDYPGGKYVSIRDFGQLIKYGAITWEDIPEQYHDEVQAYLENFLKTHQTHGKRGRVQS